MRLYLWCWLGGGGVALLFVLGLWLVSPVLHHAGLGPLALLWFMAGLAFAGGHWGAALAMMAED